MSWRKDIVNAAILAGKSQQCRELPTAFLCNMFAIETLITQQGDKYSNDIPLRIESLLGWVGFWETDKYEERIRELYKKRCALVHQGNLKVVNIEDLLISDDLILNLFVNLISNLKLFPKKEALIDFADKVDCERRLCVKSKVRPKSLQVIQRTYTDADKKKLW